MMGDNIPTHNGEVVTKITELFTDTRSKELTNDSRIILIDLPEAQYGMIVDSVMEVQRVKIEDIEEAPELVTRGTRKFLEGVVKKDNKLILLIDVEQILTEGEKKELKQADIS